MLQDLMGKRRLPKMLIFGTSHHAARTLENLVPQTIGKSVFSFVTFLTALENRTFVHDTTSGTVGSKRTLRSARKVNSVQVLTLVGPCSQFERNRVCRREMLRNAAIPKRPSPSSVSALRQTSQNLGPDKASIAHLAMHRQRRAPVEVVHIRSCRLAR